MENAKLDIGPFEALWEGKSSAIARDLKLNLSRIATEGALNAREAGAAVLAVAAAVEYPELEKAARAELAKQGLDEASIQEAAESAAIMGMNNTYYRFRYMVASRADSDAAQAYASAGLRMTGLARPALGKELFEMLAFAVSVINGCQSCIVSHEKSLRDAGVDAAKVHDLARLAAVVKGLKVISRL